MGLIYKYQKGGRAPIYTTDKKDPRLLAYTDSLNLYNLDQAYFKALDKSNKDSIKKANLKYYNNSNVFEKTPERIKLQEAISKLDNYENKKNEKIKNEPKEKNPIPIVAVNSSNTIQYSPIFNSAYKKPVQPVKLKKAEPPVEEQRVVKYTDKGLYDKAAEAEKDSSNLYEGYLKKIEGKKKTYFEKERMIDVMLETGKFKDGLPVLKSHRESSLEQFKNDKIKPIGTQWVKENFNNGKRVAYDTEGNPMEGGTELGYYKYKKPVIHNVYEEPTKQPESPKLIPKKGTEVESKLNKDKIKGKYVGVWDKGISIYDYPTADGKTTDRKYFNAKGEEVFPGATNTNY